MKQSDWQKTKAKTLSELKSDLAQEQKDLALAKIAFQPDKKPRSHELKLRKRRIARLKTLIREKELSEA